MDTIDRKTYLNRLISKKGNGLIKIITGLRRSGKSYLLFTLYYDYLLSIGVKKERIITLSLDDDRYREYRNADKLSNFLHSQITDQKEMFYILLDEVQFAISDEELKNNEPIRLYGILNGLLNRKNVDIYITGSNSKFLSSDVMTEFRGRGDEVRVYPLSFAEFMTAYKGNKFDGFAEYSTYGGLPMVLAHESDDEKAEYLSTLFKNVYLKDIIERNKLRGDILMDSITDVLASAVGSLTNPTKLANTFISNGIKANAHTITSHIDCLIDAFVLSKAQRYDIKGKKYIGSPLKYYFTDIGLRNVRLNFRQDEQTHIMENIIYNELIVRRFNVDVGIVEYRKRDNDGKQIIVQSEVDFVCNSGNRRYYVQSAFSIPDREKMAQECASLDRIDDSFKKIMIVGDNVKPWRNEKGYMVMSILDFLLNPDSLDL